MFNATTLSPLPCTHYLITICAFFYNMKGDSKLCAISIVNSWKTFIIILTIIVTITIIIFSSISISTVNAMTTLANCDCNCQLPSNKFRLSGRAKSLLWTRIWTALAKSKKLQSKHCAPSAKVQRAKHTEKYSHHPALWEMGDDGMMGVLVTVIWWHVSKWVPLLENNQHQTPIN